MVCGRMKEEVVCITNNPLWPLESDTFTFVDGMPWDVFTLARDLIHGGWSFLGHPLYGNFNPCRHPYRTLLLAKEDGKDPSVDFESFTMLEAALAACRDEMRQNPEPKEIPQRMKDDYAILDKALLKEPVETYFLKGGRS